MPERLFGLPSHPLLVHIPVVLLPLCFIFAIFVVVKPRLVEHFGVPLLIVSLVAVIGTVLAASSGEGLESILNKHNAAIQDHAEWGDRTRLVAVVFFLLITVFVALARRVLSKTVGTTGIGNPPRNGLVTVFGVLALVAGTLMCGAVIQTGHSGAKSAWEDAGKG
jgi:uncharacterized membrane protein